ncbi:lasso peptide biosynthesis PqqD family chaperone [Paenibacillus sp. GCM10012307]|uniref:Lasso peptide biosynthesis PqqD family chaperone n=1 Tax=Paenibacillus roseus TaxID=2798579 RepID=A0A934J4G4_9BACL|nr:lasso peptide biosynthesis PqqD family chaperone [Paenibacillus roseus]MBJ6360245.1 lasso peptide biosynthesis PqqD family chaperone [Paenibacillus roseus]
MSVSIIQLEDKIQQEEGNLVSDMAGEKVMMSIRSGKYYNLGSMGGIIWESIASGQTVGQLIDDLTERYEVAREECQTQVLSFLQQLKQEGLISLLSE